MSSTEKEKGKRMPDGGSDFLRFPMGTKLAATANGKLSISFAGDVSIGESLPELGELSSGRNLSVDAGVVLNSDRIVVKGDFEANPGSKVTSKHLEAQNIKCRRAEVRSQEISTTNLEAENCTLQADHISTKENVIFDKGEQEIGIVKGQKLVISKGTQSNIMIADVDRLEGSIAKGGYRNFQELLSKLYLYCREVLNEKSLQEAKKYANLSFSQEIEKLAPPPPTPVEEPPEVIEKESPSPPEKAAEPEPALEIPPETDSYLIERLQPLAKNFLNLYTGKELPREIQEVIAYIELKKIEDLRKNLNSCYQRLAQRTKVSDEITEIFFSIQKIFKEEARLKREKHLDVSK